MTTRAQFTAGAAAAFTTIGIAVPARAQTLEYKLAHNLKQDHPMHVRCVQAASRIAKESNGRLRIRIFPDNQLGADPSMLTQLRANAIEILLYPGAFLNTLVPIASIENVAFAFPNRDVAFKAMDGKLGEMIRAEIRAKDMMALDRVFENGYRDITTSVKPIRTVDDLAGLKIRVSPGKIRIDTFQSLGASPTPIAVNELYTALQTHIVDAQENPLLNIETQRFFEVQKYCSLSHHMWTAYTTLINMESWKKLSPDLQKILAKEINQAALEERHDSLIIAASLQDKLSRQGLVFNTVDRESFKRKLVSAGYYGRWKTEFGPQAWATLEEYTGKLG